MSKSQRAIEIHNRLRKLYPNAKPALVFANPFQLLIVVMLSAQTTDDQVNKASPALFTHFSSALQLATADPTEVEHLVKSLGFFHQKTKSIIGASKLLIEKYGGEVPRTIDELVELPGVGRKTANIVLAEAFGLSSGIAVDTHVGRIARRLGLSKHTDANKVEQDLLELFPQESWRTINLIWIWHGRDTCQARKPRCSECVLEDICPRVGVN